MEKRLTRDTREKMIGGVAAGLADYLNIDATVVRLLFVLATLFHGSGLLVYIILWIAMPERKYGQVWETGAYGEPATGQPGVSPGAEKPKENRSSAIIGWILVGLGLFFLMDEFMYPWFRDIFGWLNFRRIWPAVFIIVGVLIISSASRKRGRSDNQGEGPSRPGEGGQGPVHPPGPVQGSPGSAPAVPGMQGQDPARSEGSETAGETTPPKKGDPGSAYTGNDPAERTSFSEGREEDQGLSGDPDRPEDREDPRNPRKPGEPWT